MIGLQSWQFRWWVIALSLSLGLLAGCDDGRTSNHMDGAGHSRLSLMIQTTAIQESRQFFSSHTARRETRQVIDPLGISSLRVEVTGPELAIPVIATVFEVMEPQVLIELEVPQGPARHIRVEVFNEFTAMIFRGVTIIDLVEPVHDVELMLEPIPSVNPILVAPIDAGLGDEFRVESAAAGLAELTITIPPGALDANTVLTMGTRNHPYLLPRLPNGVVPMGPVLDFESSEGTLLSPFWLTLPYDPVGLNQLGATASDLRLFHRVDGEPGWREVIASVVHPDLTLLSAPLDTFGSVRLGFRAPR